MDYGKTAKLIIEGIGGKENIISAAHCATRLRLVIADNGKCKKEEIENIEGVKGVFEASGQLQVILGTGVVNKVYDEFIKLADISAASKEEVKQAAASKQNVFMRAIKILGDIFVPIIPAIVASGLLMGLLEGLSNVFPAMTQSGTYTIIHLFSNAAFVFLPVLIAISAAKTFGGNMFLGAVIGMIMIHPDLMNAWSVAGAEAVPTASAWFGMYDINLVGYQGHVIPVVIAVFVMSFIEKRLHKIVPEMIDLFVTPLVTVLVTGYLSLTILGPVFSSLENWVLDGVQFLISIPFGIGAFFTGGLYAPTVVAGVHHMYNALEAGMLSAKGVNTWMPIATAANVAQGAAALALALKTKNKKTQAMALPASLSAFLGITEPAIFGVNIRFMKPFIAGCIGGAFGALYAAIAGIGATAYGITGLFGFLITTDYALSYLITMLIAGGIAFAISWVLYKDEVKAENGKTEKKEIEEKTKIEEKTEDMTIYSPLSGEVIAMEEIPDETFASGALGKAIGIIPNGTEVKAPLDGEVTMIFDTHHAIGLMGDNGVELLIHVGLDTVTLNGEPFTCHVTEGTRVKKGDLLLTFDAEKIKKAGLSTVTPVVITNADLFREIQVSGNKLVDTGAALCTAVK